MSQEGSHWAGYTQPAPRKHHFVPRGTSVRRLLPQLGGQSVDVHLEVFVLAERPDHGFDELAHHTEGLAFPNADPEPMILGGRVNGQRHVVRKALLECPGLGRLKTFRVVNVMDDGDEHCVFPPPRSIPRLAKRFCLSKAFRHRTSIQARTDRLPAPQAPKLKVPAVTSPKHPLVRIETFWATIACCDEEEPTVSYLHIRARVLGSTPLHYAG